MRLEYRTSEGLFMEDGVTSIVGSQGDVTIFINGDTHYKYLISGSTMKKYEMTSSFYTMIFLINWRITE